jgi:chromodomain-containing protein/p58 integrase-like protein
LEELSTARSDVQASLEKHAKPYFPNRSFQVNNQVWFDARNLKVKAPSKKLSPRHYGPFTILEQVSPVAYHISLPQSVKIYDVFHVDRLIPFTETQEYGKAYPQPPPELIDGEEEYKIEEILDDCIKPRTCNLKQYFVKWKGYAQSENSWVNEKDLHASDLLEEYLASKA